MSKKANVNQIISEAINMIGKSTYLEGTEKSTRVKGFIEDIKMIGEEGSFNGEILEKDIEIKYKVRWDNASIGIWCGKKALSIFQKKRINYQKEWINQRSY